MTLKFYKYKNLESVFIEVLSKSGKINTVGCTYQHLNLTRQEFMDTFLEPFLDKFSYENKILYFYVTLILTCHVMYHTFKQDNS